MENMSHVKNIAAKHFCDASIQISRVPEGSSTFVYRVGVGNETFYLRVLPEEGASFAPEVEVHRRLGLLGVRVPEVVYFDGCDEVLQRSVMITTEIKGEPISRSPELTPEEVERVVAEAGRELAVINGVGVEGFGWVVREGENLERLLGEKRTFREFALENWEEYLRVMAQHGLSAGEARGLEGMVGRYDDWLEVDEGRLAHGDFDSTHIYQEDGKYTGIIDFGEIRGADSWYDTGHFHLRDGEETSGGLEAALMRGYGEVVKLPEDWTERVRFAGVLINVRALARAMGKGGSGRYVEHLVGVLRKDMRGLR